MKDEYDFSKSERGRFYHKNVKEVLPDFDCKPDWIEPEGKLGRFIVNESEKSLKSYREQPNLITEHARAEFSTVHGGYAHRQLFELVQNSADALRRTPKGKAILVRLTENFLYCADDGKPLDERGIEGLMFSHMPNKEGDDIGRFGIGFKSVLGVTDAPEFYSRPISFRFDKARAAERLAKITSAKHYPVLRLPEPFDPNQEKEKDEDLSELMSWATNIVRLPLKPGVHSDLIEQMQNFPPEFLLFVDHVRYLTLENQEKVREFMLNEQEGELHLNTGEGTTHWRRFQTIHHLSPEGRSDWPLHNESDDVLIRWAAPLNHLDRPGFFWAFFPTSTASLVAGILNAPWKTNEDRQNLLPGPYNEELINAAAQMIAHALPKLANSKDPAKHLDALPRRHEAGDSELAELLRKTLFSVLHENNIVPDQDGNLCAREDILYPPKVLTSGGQVELKPIELWEEYSGRPSNWLHHKALTRNRLAIIDRLFHPEGEPPRWQVSGAPRVEVAQWLQALVKGKEGDEAIQASIAAIRTAVAIPPERRSSVMLGKIVLTANGDWQLPDPEQVFLPDFSLNGCESIGMESCVHTRLVEDHETLAALKELGLKSPSPESKFRSVVRRILQSCGNQDSGNAIHREFWTSSRRLSSEVINSVIQEYMGEGQLELKVRVRTREGVWQPLYSVLLPGKIVPEDGNRDTTATVDTQFHRADDKLLRELGVMEVPCGNKDLSFDLQFKSFRSTIRSRYNGQGGLPHRPNWAYLDFESCSGVGPLEILSVLSDEGRARYTDYVLSLDTTYQLWTMWHTGSNRMSYPKMSCESLTIHVLREYGSIQISDGIVPLSDALGSPPKCPEALHTLLRHPKADKIKEVFELAEPMPEFFGEGEPLPLTDVWPGLKQYLPPHRNTCRLIRCERILVVGQTRLCVFQTPDVFLADTIDENDQHTLQLVVDELGLDLTPQQIYKVLHRKTPQEIEQRRAAIRQKTTDAERLFSAVGGQELRTGLPDALVAVLESEGVALTGIDIAEAAIATWHTDALKQYKHALDHLDPPKQWAGSTRAVAFVQSLGFSAEWAGERGRKRDPYVEVEGPYTLPDLHEYQKQIARNIRDMLCGKHGDEAGRRGMLSMPTGSGKTRVAVQAVVEAMRHDDFHGGILWVADRDELCEQAVEAWRQVWSSIGTQAVRLRISRMWSGMERPQPVSEQHVVISTIQTLHSRLKNEPGEYEFLADFSLVVFDEAHRSIAPTFTSVMEELGLTRYRRQHEPLMLGLTATPYRGHDLEETERLVGRYGTNRLDAGSFSCDEPEGVIRELQDMGVLAQADHATIEGETFSLEAILRGSFDSDDYISELNKWQELPWLPQEVENRIAQSTERTKRIIGAYEEYVDPDWPTLIFATSVKHAQTVAALLNRKGIRSRAVSGETETLTRRRVVEKFRRGEIKALVNYGVFREGFDAPKTRSIIVARPVYSPNLYFQMIGRGLRGPLNGGSDRCLILNVQDNIESFERRLAFSELDWLWAS
ncbi:MAG: DEAD/DEAH box helicase [Gammaproteobacteria bacterium]|nr:DEAD/DEAH box helicase [Gammaproteobacteria bacterium]